MTPNIRAVVPVAGLGSRRENQSWNNLRDIYSKAGVNGRRIKTVLEWLEADPKRALQETERIIKKFGIAPPFAACKALAMHRLDPQNPKTHRTCGELLDGIVVNAELDELTICAVIHFYQHETSDYAGLHRFLQKVAAASKGSTAVLDLLLLTYLRHHNAKEMQKVAMDLAKLDPINADRHYLLTVFSLIMQSFDCVDLSKRRTILSLAYRTLEKRFPITSPKSQELRIKLWLLGEVGDTDAFAQTMEAVAWDTPRDAFSNLAYKGFCLAYSRMLIRKEHLKEAEIFMLTLPEGASSLELMDLFVKIKTQQSLRRIAGMSNEEASITPSIVNSALTEMDVFMTRYGDSMRKIAKLEFIRQFCIGCKLTEALSQQNGHLPESAAGSTSAAKEKLMQLIGDYFETVGNRACFYTDVAKYLQLLDSDQVQQFFKKKDLLENFAAISLAESDSRLGSVAEVLRHQNALILSFAFRRLLKESQAKEQVYRDIDRLLSLRVFVSETASFANGQNLEMIKLGDTYASLSIYRLFDLFKEHGDWSTIFGGVVLLENLLKKAKHLCNPSFRMLLIHLYLRCGAVSLALEQFKQLDIKSLQLNHLSFLVLTASLVSGVSESAAELLDSLVRFYTGTIFETCESQMHMMGKSEFYQLIELEALKKSLKYSSTAILANYARLWSSSTQQVLRDVDARNWSMDTERFLGASVLTIRQESSDYDVLPSWDVSWESQADQRSTTAQAEQAVWLSVMNEQMSCYSASMTLALTYFRYNPFLKVPLREQLADHVPFSQLDLATDGLAVAKSSSDAYFQVCKSFRTIPDWTAEYEENLRHLTASFPHPLHFYVLLGCHAVNLRLVQFVVAVQTVMCTAVQEYGGSAAFSVSVESQPGDETGACGGDAKEAKEVNLFGEALRSCEFPLKFEQMICDIFSDFEKRSSDISRYRDLLIKTSLLLQVMRQLLWVVQNVKSSLLSLYDHNSTRKDAAGKLVSKAADFRKLLDDWFGEFCTFLDDFLQPVQVLARRLLEEGEKLIWKPIPDYLQPFFSGAELLSQVKLCSDEPSKVQDIVEDVAAQMIVSWRTSLLELQTLCTESHSLLNGFINEIKDRPKAKSKASK